MANSGLKLTHQILTLSFIASVGLPVAFKEAVGLAGEVIFPSVLGNVEAFIYTVVSVFVHVKSVHSSAPAY